ncbi:MAG: hypothetical protein ACTIJJ_02645 [Galactobacter sp.]
MQRWEIVAINGNRVGGLWREFVDSTLTTRIGFRADPEQPNYLAQSVIRFQPDGEGWQRYRFRQDPGGVDVDCDRIAAGLPLNSLPSYGEYMLLLDVISQREAGASYGEATQTYVRLQDSDPTMSRPARIVVADTDVIHVDGRQVEAERLEVLQEDVVVGRHWVAEDALVRSDWNGPVSWRVSRDEVLGQVEGVSPEIARFLNDGFPQ